MIVAALAKRGYVLIRLLKCPPIRLHHTKECAGRFDDARRQFVGRKLVLDAFAFKDAVRIASALSGPRSVRIWVTVSTEPVASIS